MTGLARRERDALCDLLLEVGPDAPTLCDGWSAADLAAHLVLRERRPDAAPGILLAPLSAYTARVQRSIRSSSSWEALVAQVRGGPPGPIRPLDETVNTLEYFVHHEDVRRAGEGWRPRDMDPDDDRVLWTRTRGLGRLLARRAPNGLQVEAPGYGPVTLKAGHPAVVATGAPGELVLLLFGRGSHSTAHLDGDEVSVERLRHARLGI